MSFLSDILARKRDEVAARKRSTPEGELARRVRDAPAGRGLAKSLSRRGGPMRVIAEVKRASPSAGALRSLLDPAALAGAYEKAGAAAVSVLTDGPGFGGSLDDLRAVRAAVELPVLRKDFVIDAYQLLEAREAGADAVLLIVAALPPDPLAELLSAAAELGLDALVEIHDAAELDQALGAGATLLGVNNRNLATFEVSLTTSELLLPRIPDSHHAVAESGVRSRKDGERLRLAGAANLLVGEALVRATDPAALLAELSSVG